MTLNLVPLLLDKDLCKKYERNFEPKSQNNPKTSTPFLNRTYKFTEAFSSEVKQVGDTLTKNPKKAYRMQFIFQQHISVSEH